MKPFPTGPQFPGPESAEPPDPEATEMVTPAFGGPASPRKSGLLRALSQRDTTADIPVFAQVPTRVDLPTLPAPVPPPVPAPLPTPASAVHLPTVPVADASDAPAEEGACPRCQTPLIDPAGLGWCRACGYCRSLEEDRVKLPAKQQAPRKPSTLGLVEFFILLTKIPEWAYWLVAGCITAVAASVGPAYQLPPESLERAVWSSAQIGLGLALILTGQVIAVVLLAPRDEKLSFKDVLVPFRLWGLVFHNGPHLRVPLWLGTWGVAAILSAVFIIGGLEYWMRYLPRKSAPPPPPVVVQPK